MVGVNRERAALRVIVPSIPEIADRFLISNAVSMAPVSMPPVMIRAFLCSVIHVVSAFSLISSFSG